MAPRAAALLFYLVICLTFCSCTKRAGAAWNRYHERLAQISIKGRPLPEVLGSALFRYEYVLSKPQAERSLVYQGQAARLRVLLHSLSSLESKDRPFSVAVVGSSATCRAAPQGQAQVGWPSLLNKTLHHVFPHLNIQMHVGCKTDKPLTTKHAVACFRQLVPERPDLVLIELGSQEFAAAGDNVFHNKYTPQYELVIRYALGGPPAPPGTAAARAHWQPAVILVHLPAEDIRGITHGVTPFHHTVEDLTGPLALYYDLPWLSLRDALWVDLVAPGGSSHNTSSHSSLHSQPPESGRPAVHDSHVSSTGSDTAPTWQAVMGAAEGGLAQLGHRMVADMVTWLLHKTMLRLAYEPLGESDKQLAARPLPPPMRKDVRDVLDTLPMC